MKIPIIIGIGSAISEIQSKALGMDKGIQIVCSKEVTDKLFSEPDVKKVYKFNNPYKEFNPEILFDNSESGKYKSSNRTERRKKERLKKKKLKK